MTINDIPSLESLLKHFAEEWAGLQAAVVEREREIQQIDRRRAQLTDEIIRNQGAMAYNKRTSDLATARLESLTKAAT